VAPDQYVAMARCPAGATTWTPPQRVVDTPGHADGQPVFLLDHAGVLWLYHVTLAGRGWTSAHLRRQRSTDLGATWDAPESLGLPEGWMFRSRPLDLTPLGQPQHWLLPIYDERSWRSLMLRSTDDGATWAPGAFIATPPGNIHPCVVPLADGRLLAYLRTGGPGGSIWRTTSADHGYRWEAPVPTALPNPNAGLDLLRRGDPRRSGALVLAFNNSRRRRSRLCLALSDDGQTWSSLRTLEAEHGEFSYPTLIEDHSGQIHGVYTWRRQTIQHFTCDEAWLRAGLPWNGAVG
jgi:predicted neuraminidase